MAAPPQLPCGLGAASLTDSLEAGLALALEWGERKKCFWPSCSAPVGLLYSVGLPLSALCEMDRPAG